MSDPLVCATLGAEKLLRRQWREENAGSLRKMEELSQATNCRIFLIGSDPVTAITQSISVNGSLAFSLNEWKAEAKQVISLSRMLRDNVTLLCHYDVTHFLELLQEQIADSTDLNWLSGCFAAPEKNDDVIQHSVVATAVSADQEITDLTLTLTALSAGITGFSHKHLLGSEEFEGPLRSCINDRSSADRLQQEVKALTETLHSTQETLEPLQIRNKEAEDYTQLLEEQLEAAVLEVQTITAERDQLNRQITDLMKELDNLVTISASAADRHSAELLSHQQALSTQRQREDELRHELARQLINHKAELSLVARKFATQRRKELLSVSSWLHSIGDLPLLRLLNVLLAALRDSVTLRRRHRRLAVKDHPLFDSDWYLSTYPDVRRSKMSASDHFFYFGAREGRRPSKSFDSLEYMAQTRPDATGDINPILNTKHTQ